MLYSTKRAWLSQRYPNSQRRSQTAARGVSTGAGPLHGGAARRSPMQCITRVSRHAARHSCLRARPPGPVGPRPSSHRAGRHRPLYNHRPYRESRLASAAVPPAGTVHLSVTSTCARACLWSGREQSSDSKPRNRAALRSGTCQLTRCA